jgi:glycosyltransferase involved in cell wall biosynthesis
MPMKEGVSIAICTFGRPEFVKKCLTKFDELYRNSSFQPPILLIDNNKDNRTLNSIKSIIDSNKCIHYHKEEKLGLCNARNRAVSECSTKYIAFVDDDAYPSATYLYELSKMIAEEFDVGGGNEIPFSDKKIPEWLKSNKTAASVEYLSGYNIIFNVQSLISVGGFNAEIGMQGKKIAYGDEILPQVLLKRNDAIFFYNPKLLVHHHIQQYKLSRRWHVANEFKYGRDSWKIYAKDTLNKRDILNLLIQIAKPFKCKNAFQLLQLKAYQLGRFYGGISHVK